MDANKRGSWYSTDHYRREGFVQLVRRQLPEQARDAFRIVLNTDAYGIKIIVSVQHVRTEIAHEFQVARDLIIPDRDLAYLMVLDQ